VLQIAGKIQITVKKSHDFIYTKRP